MLLTGVNPDSSNREKLDIAIRVPSKTALDTESVSIDELVFLLTRMLAELAEGGIVAGHLMAAYDLLAKRGQKPILLVEHIDKLIQLDQKIAKVERLLSDAH